MTRHADTVLPALRPGHLRGRRGDQRRPGGRRLRQRRGPRPGGWPASALDSALSAHGLDAVISLTGSPAWLTDHTLGDHHTFGTSSPAAVSGYPAITVPAGRVHGLPVGLSFARPGLERSPADRARARVRASTVCTGQGGWVRSGPLFFYFTARQELSDRLRPDQGPASARAITYAYAHLARHRTCLNLPGQAPETRRSWDTASRAHWPWPRPGTPPGVRVRDNAVRRHSHRPRGDLYRVGSAVRAWRDAGHESPMYRTSPTSTIRCSSGPRGTRGLARLADREIALYRARHDRAPGAATRPPYRRGRGHPADRGVQRRTSRPRSALRTRGRRSTPSARQIPRSVPSPGSTRSR